MTGLLQRLASRATGQAWTLRSDARLPFATLAPLPEVEPSAPAFSPAQASEPTATPAITGQNSAQAPHATPQNTTSPQIPEPLATPVHTAPHRQSNLSATVQGQDAQRPAATSAPQDAPGGWLHPHNSPHAATRVVPDVDTPPQTTRAAFSTQSSTQPIPPRLLSARSAYGMQAMTAAVATPAHIRSNPQPSTTQRHRTHAQPAAPTQPAEVHVHIGRIEVTAVTEAPAPAPARARSERPQPMSLDAYLARRKESS